MWCMCHAVCLSCGLLFLSCPVEGSNNLYIKKTQEGKKRWLMTPLLRDSVYLSQKFLHAFILRCVDFFVYVLLNMGVCCIAYNCRSNKREKGVGFHR